MRCLDRGASAGRNIFPMVGVIVGFLRSGTRGSRAGLAVILTCERHAKAFFDRGLRRCGIGLCHRGTRHESCKRKGGGSEVASIHDVNSI